MAPDHQDPLTAALFFLFVIETSKINTRAPEISRIPVNDAGSIAFWLKAILQMTEFAAKAVNASKVKNRVLVVCLREKCLVKLFFCKTLKY